MDYQRERRQRTDGVGDSPPWLHRVQIKERMQDARDGEDCAVDNEGATGKSRNRIYQCEDEKYGNVLEVVHPGLGGALHRRDLLVDLGSAEHFGVLRIHELLGARSSDTLR